MDEGFVKKMLIGERCNADPHPGSILVHVCKRIPVDKGFIICWLEVELELLKPQDVVAVDVIGCDAGAVEDAWKRV